jgi:hypothetical protein
MLSKTKNEDEFVVVDKKKLEKAILRQSMQTRLYFSLI